MVQINKGILFPLLKYQKKTIKTLTGSGVAKAAEVQSVRLALWLLWFKGFQNETIQKGWHRRQIVFKGSCEIYFSCVSRLCSLFSKALLKKYPNVKLFQGNVPFGA